jgi:hypothetical protein
MERILKTVSTTLFAASDVIGSRAESKPDL